MIAAILARVDLINEVVASETGVAIDNFVGGNEVIDAIDSNIVDGRHVCGGHNNSLEGGYAGLAASQY